MHSLGLLPNDFSSYERDFLESALEQHKEELTFGNVDVVTPSSLLSYGISKERESYIKREHFKYLEKQDLVPDSLEQALLIGMGSVGPHKDEINGICALTLLAAIPMTVFNTTPEYEGNNGEFFHTCNKRMTFEPMLIGNTIIFDDRLNHAWLTNSMWIFASTPINVQS